MVWNSVETTRREALALASIFGFAALLAPKISFADEQTVAAEIKKLYADKKFDGGKIKLDVPEIAENGAVVPIGITSNIPKTESIAILVEKNPNMLAAVFDVPAGTDPSLSTRIKMGQSSNVYALVKADGKYFVASKEIKVTLGGCGG